MQRAMHAALHLILVVNAQYHVLVDTHYMQQPCLFAAVHKNVADLHKRLGPLWDFSCGASCWTFAECCYTAGWVAVQRAGVTFGCGWSAGTITSKRVAPPGLEATMQVGKMHACMLAATVLTCYVNRACMHAGLAVTCTAVREHMQPCICSIAC
jgi:hypothetical protein